MATNTGHIDYNEGAAPATPATGKVRIYAKTDGLLYSKDDAGAETLVSGGAGGGSVATDAIFDAKGDLAVGTGSNTAAKLTVGANGRIPVAASGESTGIRWGYAPGFHGCRARANATTTVNNATYTKVAFAGTDDYDTDAFHDPSTNNTRLTIPTGMDGYYTVWGSIGWDSNATGERILGYQVNNASGGEVHRQRGPVYANMEQSFSTEMYLAAADYVEMIVYQNSGSARTVGSSALHTAFGLSLIGT